MARRKHVDLISPDGKGEAIAKAPAKFEVDTGAKTYGYQI